MKVPRLSTPTTAQNPTQLTSLATACYHGDLGRVSELVRRDPDLVHQVDDEGRTALHFAAYQSAVHVATHLLDTILLSDVVLPFKHTLKELRSRTEELEKSCVSEQDHRLCEQWLLEEKERQCLEFQIQCTTVAVNVFSRVDNTGCTPLHYAATTQDNTLGDLVDYPERFVRQQLASSAFRALLKSGAVGHGTKEDITERENKEKREYHMQQKMARTTRKLWRQCVHVKNQRLNTVLHFAACSGSTSAVRCLVRLGANHALQNDGAQSALDVCESKTCRAALLRLPQAVDEVCDRGMKENQGGGGGLSTVALNGAIQSLLNHGEHVNATSSIQGTWVGVGCCLIGLNGVFMVVLLFFSCSLVFCFVLSGTTALHRACSRGAHQVVVELLDGNGADPCATDANGWTGLHCCGYYSTAEHGKIAKELLNRDVNVRFSFVEILFVVSRFDGEQNQQEEH